MVSDYSNKNIFITFENSKEVIDELSSYINFSKSIQVRRGNSHISLYKPNFLLKPSKVLERIEEYFSEDFGFKVIDDSHSYEIVIGKPYLGPIGKLREEERQKRLKLIREKKSLEYLL